MQFPNQLNLGHFEEMALLERQFYTEDYITPPEEAYRWYRKYPYSCVAAAVDGRIAGFVNLFPVSFAIYSRLRAGSFNDRDLSLDCITDIHGDEEQPLYMFLSCIVVDKGHQKTGLSHALLQKAAAQYVCVSPRCRGILLDAVTMEGRAFARRYGFSPIGKSEHASFLYEQEYQNFCRKLESMEEEGKTP